MNSKIDIAKHLEELLYEYSSVIVPQLGAFNTRYQAATLDTKSQQISPPIKTVTFNDRLKIDDGLLSSHIARTEKMPLEQVEKQLHLFVNKSLERLRNGETVVLENIGELQKDEFNQTGFAPFAGANFFANTFGLATLDLPNSADLEAASPSAGVGMASVSGGALTTPLDDLVPGNTQAAQPPTTTSTTTPPSSSENMSERKRPSEVLAANATKKHRTGEVIPPPPRRKKKSGSGFWLWFLPILILFLLGTLLWQLHTSNRPWKEHKPFSYLLSEGEDNIFANNNKPKSSDKKEEGSKALVSTDTNKTNEENNKDTSGVAKTEDTENSNTSNDSKLVDSDKGTNATNSTNNKPSKTQSSDQANSNSSNHANSSDKQNSDNEPERKNSTASNGKNTSGENAVVLSARERKRAESRAGLQVTNANTSEYMNNNTPKGYYIVVGAFGSKTNANKLVNKINRAGLKGQILNIRGSSLNRVGVYAGTEPSKVPTQWTKAKNKYNAGAWVLSYH